MSVTHPKQTKSQPSFHIIKQFYCGFLIYIYRYMCITCVNLLIREAY